MKNKTASTVTGGAGLVLSALLATQLMAGTGAEGHSSHDASHHGSDRVAKTWAFAAADLGEARNLSTEIVLGRIGDVRPAQLVVPVPGEPGGVDRIAMDVVTVDVQKAYKGTPGRQLSLLYTRGIPPEPPDGEDIASTPQRTNGESSEPGPQGALTDDPTYAPGEQYVLFLRPGRPLSDLGVQGTTATGRVILAPEGRYRVASTGLVPVSDRTFSHSMAGIPLPEFERRLASLDSDGDGVKDGDDNCPAFPNGSQSAPPWPVPADDPDCDGFPTRVDNFTGRLPLVACPATPAASDERHDPWPADLNDDRVVDGLDLSLLESSLGTQAGSESGGADERYVSRHDLNADLRVDDADLALLRTFSGTACR